MPRKGWKKKTWSDFYEEFRREVEGILGESMTEFYDKRAEEILAGTRMKFSHLGQTEFQMILECFAKLRGQKYKRYYKSNYKKTFKQLMEDAIEGE
jgi:hypothetical protein